MYYIYNSNFNCTLHHTNQTDKPPTWISRAIRSVSPPQRSETNPPTAISLPQFFYHPQKRMHDLASLPPAYRKKLHPLSSLPSKPRASSSSSSSSSLSMHQRRSTAAFRPKPRLRDGGGCAVVEYKCIYICAEYSSKLRRWLFARPVS